MPFDDWMPTLKQKMEEIPELEQVHVYDDLPAAILVWPSLIILPIQGRVDYGAGGPQTAHHELQLTAYVASQIAPEGYSTAVPLIEAIRNKLAANITLDGKVAHCLPSAEAAFYDGPGGIVYAGTMHMGIIFRIRVKENESGTYTVAA